MNQGQQPKRWRVSASPCLKGRIRVPGDKSISHRAVMLGAIGDGDLEVSGLLEGEDVIATIGAFRAMGVGISGPDHNEVLIHGARLTGLKAPAGPLDMGNSGTAMRLLAGILSAQPFDSELTGDASLTGRPMARVVDPLNRAGAKIETAAGGRPPLRIHGGRRINGGRHELRVASAQVKSALLLAGLYAQAPTGIVECGTTRDHTERMLEAFGVPVSVDGRNVVMEPRQPVSPGRLEVPSDLSSAAFFIVAALITPGSELVIENVGINPSRSGLLDVLGRMGANIRLSNQRQVGAEPVADLTVVHGPLTAADIGASDVERAIDEIPVIAIAAALAGGTSTISGAAELRVKESDRIAAVARGLETLGAAVEERPDGLVITGGDRFGGGRVRSFADHRIAMAMAIAANRSESPVDIDDCTNVATSFPDFDRLARSLGMTIETPGQ